MVDPITQHLYVMQNEFGAIKIGRSCDPRDRKNDLQFNDRCKVSLIAAFDGGGENEEGILYKLRRHRLVGEWFDGGNTCRVAVERIFSGNVLEWKYPHDPAGSAEWVEHLNVVRAARHLDKMIGSELREIRAWGAPGTSLDRRIHRIWRSAQTNGGPFMRQVLINGRAGFLWYNPATREMDSLPSFTTDLTAALSIWPEEDRPNSWQGSALECCLGALAAIKDHLPKVPRRERDEG